MAVVAGLTIGVAAAAVFSSSDNENGEATVVDTTAESIADQTTTASTEFVQTSLPAGSAAPTPADFKAAAEQIVRKEAEITLGLGGDVAIACNDPSSNSVGTAFDCFATASDGSAYIFSAEISGVEEVTVRFVPAAVDPGATVPTTQP